MQALNLNFVSACLVFVAGFSVCLCSPGLSLAMQPFEEGRSRDFPSGFYTGLRAQSVFAPDLSGKRAGASPDRLQGSVSPGFGGSAAFGYRFDAPFQAELELRSGTAELEEKLTSAAGTVTRTGSLDRTGLYANGYVRMPDDLWTGQVRPWIGAGLGAVHVSGFSDSDDSLNPSVQAMAGVEYPLSSQLAFRSGYRYARTMIGDRDTPAGQRHLDDLQEHGIEIGVTWHFGEAETGRDHPPTGAPRAVSSPAPVLSSSSRAASSSSVPSPVLSSPSGSSALPSGPSVAGVQRISLPAAAPFATELASESHHEFFRAHITSYKSPRVAGMGWAVLEKRYPDLLQGMLPSLTREIVPGKGPFYRLSVTGLGKDEAGKLCEALQARGQWCGVEKAS